MRCRGDLRSSVSRLALKNDLERTVWVGSISMLKRVTFWGKKSKEDIANNISDPNKFSYEHERLKDWEIENPLPMKHHLYKVLGLEPGATQTAIKKAAMQKLRMAHPDKTGGNGDWSKEVVRAFKVLRNSESKQKYDEYGDWARFYGNRGEVNPEFDSIIPNPYIIPI